MASSKERVRQAAASAGLAIDIVTMPEATRTAEEAAAACGCDVAQIVKSLVFEGTDSGKLCLLLVSGANRVDMDRAGASVGEALKRADPVKVRQETGFAIGGVAPIGHTGTISVWMDEDLLEHESVWAAAGAPNAVFSVSPNALQKVIGAQVIGLS